MAHRVRSDSEQNSKSTESLIDAFVTTFGDSTLIDLDVFRLNQILDSDVIQRASWTFATRCIWLAISVHCIFVFIGNIFLYIIIMCKA